MFQNDQGLVCLFQDGQKLVGGEGSADVQFSEPSVEFIEDARIVPRNVENLEALKLLQVVVQGIDQHLNRSYEDIEGVGDDGKRGLQFQFHDPILSRQWR